MTAAPTLVACRDDLADRFGRRIETEGLIEHRFLVAEQPVTFRFAGGRLVEDLTASFAHLPTHDDSGGLTVNCWVADPDDELPPLPQEAFPETSLARRVDPADASLRTHYDWEGRTILVHDLDTATAWRCCADPDLIPWWERAAPLRMSLAWHLDQNGSSFLHGAAVTRAEDAALIVGPGGSGKSTTALSCLLAGFGYLGDDYCVSSADGERVHSVYGSAKLAPVGLDAVEGFETLRADADDMIGTHGEKLVVWPNRVLADRMVASARIRAVVAPTVGTTTDSHLEPISPGVALAALAPSTILQLPGIGSLSLEHMAALTTAVPCWGLTLGSDRDGVVAAIDEVIERSVR